PGELAEASGAQGVLDGALVGVAAGVDDAGGRVNRPVLVDLGGEAVGHRAHRPSSRRAARSIAETSGVAPGAAAPSAPSATRATASSACLAVQPSPVSASVTC